MSATEEAEELDHVVVFNTGQGGGGARPTPRVGDVMFTLYGDQMQPPVTIDSGAKYVEKEPIGEPTVRQYMGSELKSIQMIGECSPKIANEVDELSEHETVEVIHPRWSGIAQIDSTSTESMGKRYKGHWVQKFTIDMTEVPDAELEVSQ